MTDTAQHTHRQRTSAYDAFRSARDLLLTHRADHETAHARFRWPRPSHFNWALDWFDVIAHGSTRHALEILQPDGTSDDMSYAELSRESDRTARWLREQGILRGHRVLLALDSRRELWECLLACLKIGAVVVPTYTTLTQAEASDRFHRGHITHVITEDELTPLFPRTGPGRRIALPGNATGWTPYHHRSDAPPEFEPEAPTPASDLAFCYFTSGTTSAPRLVAHTHASYPIGHLSSLYFNGLLPGDRHMNISAPGWAKHSWSSFFVPFTAEATVVVAPAGPTDPEALPATLRDRKIDTFCAPPSTWHALLPHLHTARPALREAVSAGEPLTESVIERFSAAWGIDIRDGYGQTETTALIGTTPGMRRAPGRLGKPLPGYRIVLRGPDGTPGDHGEICLDLATRPVGLMVGYLAEDDSIARFSAEDGLHSTGDIAERGADGRLRILGRVDDVFKCFDHRISPYELEAVIKSHEAVAEAAVIPRPHPVGGHTPHAVVVLRPGHAAVDTTADVLLRYSADRIGPELCPRSVSFAAALPLTASGKVRRSALTAAPDGFSAVGPG
ncbi:AMP-binding protein [Streptomyces kunmingensis]|uniref:AMP-binding protein n=1 Tax=Streptomyces kunmingensis TaxID=68225 RepID=A0ABU6CAK6_9ACTN|nr:AMP-binding protein [Streptomyces kunmingensis]MEB3961202.1 AMP-binding protein [Streptomyces kunmingensis]